MGFIDFVTEYQFNSSNQEKALRILVKRLKRKFGNVWRYGGDDGYQELELGGVKYNSVLLFLPAGKAVRVNITSRFEWVSIDIWKKFRFDSVPSISIDIKDVENLAPVMSELINRIVNPLPKDIEIYFSPDEKGDGLISEAKRTTPLDFYERFKRSFPNVDPSDAPWELINQMARDADILVPSIIRGQKTRKGHFSVVPPGVSPVSGEIEDQKKADDSAKKGSEPILFIKVTAQDPKTKKFLPAGEVQAAQDMYKKIQASLSGPPPDSELKDVDTLFGRMAQLTQLVCKGSITSLLIAGGPGIGKTKVVFDVIKAAGLSEGSGYVKYSGKATASAIYQTLFKWRKGGLIVFDDLDSIWGDQESTNLLKAALDSYDERAITWLSARTVDVSRMSPEDKEKYFDSIDQMIEEDPGNSRIKYPSQFPFDGRVIFISNLPFKEFDTAILSRSAKIDMTITQDQVFQRMKSILPVLGGSDIPIAKKEELFDHLVGLYASKQMVSVTMREFIKGIKLLASGVPNWKELLEYL